MVSSAFQMVVDKRVQLGGRNIAMGKFGDDELEAGNGAGGSAVRAFSVLTYRGGRARKLNARLSERG